MFKRAQFKELGSRLSEPRNKIQVISGLHGLSEDVLPMLIRHCDNERLDEKNVKRIGF